jgi:lysophospholipase L1-like esterase
MKILILTDSLGLPRNKPEFCSFEDTWPVLLRSNERNIHQVSIGAATSLVLLKQITYQKAFNPDLVILQVGIVDCAPRFMSIKELNLTGALGVFGRGIRFLFNRKWIKSLRNISYINEADFKNNILKIQNDFDCPILTLGILPAGSEYENILPGVTNKIKLYNAILEQNFENFLNSNEILACNGIMTDYHHLSKRGHHFLFKRIEEFIQNREFFNE